AVIRQVRQLYPPDAQPLVVVLTNYASDFVRDHCFAAGADYFLDKMRDISLLKAVVVDGHSKRGATARRRVDLEPAAERAHPLAHSHQAVRPAESRIGGIEAAAIVA